MPHAPKFGLVAIATLALLTLSITPTAEAGGCMSLTARDLATGLGIYFATDLSEAIGVTLASGVPDEGITLSLVVSPLACATDGQIALPESPVPSVGTSTWTPELSLPALP